MFAALTGEFGHKAQRPKFVITVFKGSGVYVCVCVCGDSIVYYLRGSLWPWALHLSHLRRTVSHAHSRSICNAHNGKRNCQIAVAKQPCRLPPAAFRPGHNRIEWQIIEVSLAIELWERREETTRRCQTRLTAHERVLMEPGDWERLRIKEPNSWRVGLV